MKNETLQATIYLLSEEDHQRLMSLTQQLFDLLWEVFRRREMNLSFDNNQANNVVKLPTHFLDKKTPLFDIF